MAEELARAARRRWASGPRSCTGTWAVSSAQRAAPLRVVALGGGHGLPASLSRAAPAHAPTSPRWSPSPTTAARPAGSGASSACCRRATCGWRWPRWPATDARRSSAWAEPAAAPVRRHRRAGRAPGRQPAAHRPAGAARPTRSPRWTQLGRAGRRGRPGAADEPGAAGPRRRGRPLRPGRSGPRPADPRPVAIAATPGRVRVDPPAAAGRAGLRGGGRRGARGRRGRARPGVLVHQRDPAPAAARAGPRRWRRPARAVSSRSTSCRRPARPTDYSPHGPAARAARACRPVRWPARSTRCRGRRTRCSDPKRSDDVTRAAIGARLVLSRLAADDSAEPARSHAAG